MEVPAAAGPQVGAPETLEEVLKEISRVKALLRTAAKGSALELSCSQQLEGLLQQEAPLLRAARAALAAAERPPYCGVTLLPHEKNSFDLWAERFAERWLAGGDPAPGDPAPRDPAPRDPVVPSTQTSPPTAAAAAERPPYCGVRLLPHEKTSFDLWAERFADRWLGGGCTHDPVPGNPAHRGMTKKVA